jgi:hypothetical protein
MTPYRQHVTASAQLELVECRSEVEVRQRELLDELFDLVDQGLLDVIDSPEGPRFALVEQAAEEAA